MPTTTSHLLPYPAPEDPADVPADIAALAEAVDAKLDSIGPDQITGATSGQLLVANSSGVVTAVTISGDVSVSNTGAANISSGAVGTDELAANAVTTGKINDGAVTQAKLAANLANVLIPVGSIFPFAGNAAPTGYLLCDGTAVSRTEYADLFSICGTSYGAGNGTSTFNLPDLKGRVLVGLDGAQTEFDARGETGGAKTHTLQSSEMPAHTHSVSGSASPAGSHSHGYVDFGSGGPVGAASGSGFSAATPTGANRTTSPDGTHTHSISVSAASTGGGSSHNNLQPYLVVNYIIRG